MDSEHAQYFQARPLGSVSMPLGVLIDVAAKSHFEPSTELGKIIEDLLTCIDGSPSPSLKKLKGFLEKTVGAKSRSSMEVSTGFIDTCTPETFLKGHTSQTSPDLDCLREDNLKVLDGHFVDHLELSGNIFSPTKSISDPENPMELEEMSHDSAEESRVNCNNNDDPCPDGDPELSFTTNSEIDYETDLPCMEIQDLISSGEGRIDPNHVEVIDHDVQPSTSTNKQTLKNKRPEVSEEYEARHSGEVECVPTKKRCLMTNEDENDSGLQSLIGSSLRANLSLKVPSITKIPFNDERPAYIQPVQLVLSQNPEKDPRVSSSTSVSSVNKASKYPSSDSVLSMPSSTKLAWEINNLKQKIDSLSSEGENSEREIYEAMLRGKQALLRLEQTRKRNSNFLFPWDLKKTSGYARSADQEYFEKTNSFLDVSCGMPAASERWTSTPRMSSPDKTGKHRTPSSSSTSTTSPFSCCRRICPRRSDARLIATSFNSSLGDSTIDEADGIRNDNEGVLRDALSGGALTIGRKTKYLLSEAEVCPALHNSDASFEEILSPASVHSLPSGAKFTEISCRLQSTLLNPTEESSSLPLDFRETNLNVRTKNLPFPDQSEEESINNLELTNYDEDNTSSTHSKHSHASYFSPPADTFHHEKSTVARFPVQMVHSTLLGMLPGFRVRKTASAFLSGVADYITSEVLDLSGQASFAQGKNIIKPRQIMLAIKGDEELSQVCKNAIIPGAGVPVSSD